MNLTNRYTRALLGSLILAAVLAPAAAAHADPPEGPGDLTTPTTDPCPEPLATCEPCFLPPEECAPDIEEPTPEPEPEPEPEPTPEPDDPSIPADPTFTG